MVPVVEMPSKIQEYYDLATLHILRHTRFEVAMKWMNLLPSSLIVGETQDLGPRFVKARSLEPIRDTSAEIVSRNHVVHQLVERLEDPAPVQVAELVAVESIHSSGAKSDPGEDEMVTRRMMSIGCFVPSTRPASQ